jgi:uncharacterized protein YfbU (UPF0304 family)
MTMETKSEMQKYIDEHIKSIAVERREDKFYGTLTDKEERTFEFSKDIIDVEKQFSNTHKTLHKDVNLKELMLLKYFKRLLIVMYARRQQFVNLGICETI